MTEVLAPPFVGAITLLALGTSADGLTGLGWGLVAALFAAGIPYLVVILGVRRGIWKDRMLTTRRQRIVPILSNLTFALLGLVVVYFAPAPRQLPALMVAAIATQAVLFFINLVWKISFHAGVSAGMALILAQTFGLEWLALGIPGILLVCWARVRLAEHSLAQVLVGAPIGGALLLTTYSLTLSTVL